MKWQRLFRLDIVFFFFLIGTVFLMVQWTLFDKNQNTKKTIIYKQSPILTFTEDFLKKFDYDYIKCKRISEERVELSDLLAYKNSYVKSLSRLEQKQMILLDKITDLENKIDKYTSDIAKLEDTNINLKATILRDILSKNELEHSIRASQLTLANAIEENKNFLNLIKQPESRLQEQNKYNLTEIECTFDSCFDYNLCTGNSNLNLFILNNNLSRITEFMDTIDKGKIAKSISFVTEPSEACLIIVFMINDITNNYYKYVSEFLAKHDNKNFVFIDTNTIDTKSFTSEILQNTTPNLKDLVSRVVISSFTSSSKSNYHLEINFSIIFDTKYLKQLTSITSYSSNYFHEKRIFLIFYNLNDTSNSASKEIIATLASGRNDIAVNCTKCQIIEERIKRLCRAKFTLITGKNCDYKRTIKVIEALKCSTIPVLVGVSMQLPLSKFIAWNEIIIRVPIAKLPYLNEILSEIDESEIIARQIKASNIYKSYFSSSTMLFRTLFAAIQSTMDLPIAGLSDHIGQELLFQGIYIYIIK